VSAVDIGQVAGRIVETNAAAAAEAQRLLDGKTKPPRSLGRLEDLVCQLAAIRGYATPRQRPAKAIVVMGADHGVAAEGVSAYPQDVTGQMLLNFARGGAAINVLARQAGARVVVVDMGVARPLPPVPEIRACRIGAGTANLARGPAMTRAQAQAALAAGAALADELARDGVGLLGIGEMGIANTTAASALAAALFMVLTKCVSTDGLKRCFDWKVLALIVGTVPLGAAMEQHGVASAIAGSIDPLGAALGPWGILGGLFLLSAVVSNMTSNAAAAVVLSPVAFQAALASAVPVNAALLAVAFGASCAFILPFSSQALILVMAPGGYRARDFLRLGLVQSTLMFLTAVTLLTLWF